MENNEELARLEQLVDTLIDKYNNLKNKFHTFEEKLRDSEDECEILRLDVAELHEQRSEVGKRVSSLLGRIELWESEQGAEAYTDVDEGEENKEPFFALADQENS